MTEKKNAPENEGGGKKGMKMALVGLGAVILLGGGVAAGFLLSGGKAAEAQVQAGGSGTESPGTVPQGGGKGMVGPMVNLESFIVNILDDQGTRYLKAAITLEVDSSNTADLISERMPQIKDAVLLLVGNKTFGELSDLQGKLQLRAELIASINDLLPQGGVRKIYFTDFVVQ